MKLKYIKIENFRAIKELELPLHPQLTVLHGDNAAGKTALLDAIAVGLGSILTHLPEVSGIKFKRHDLRQETQEQKAPYIRVELTSDEDVQWDRMERRDKTKHTAKKLPDTVGLKQLHAYLEAIINGVQDNQPVILPVIVYYGTERAVFSSTLETINRKKIKRFSALNEALESKANFRGAMEWFVTKESEEARESKKRHDLSYKLDEIEIVRQAIEGTIKSCSNLRSELNPPRLLVDFQHKQHNKQPVTLEISQLSHGFRTMLALVMDLARRMAQANPHLKNPLHEEAIVLIDEIDLHLHPKWQQTVLPDLMQTFSKTQFIVTTHSPQVLSTVHKENIWLLEDCEELGICTYRSITEPYGAESSEALHSLMHVDSRPQNLPEVKEYNRYISLVNHGQYDSVEALELRSKLEKVLEKSQFNLADMLIRKHHALKKVSSS
ncbi:AAA family ATPase [Candidatus Parabeggiatoa sp. HSG14]|uniref:AAA family ATPase n=1 Tax=Candidatus Parabeggiatoa sp. HSG14 TaxID=3055593 RepID=UPI0025A922AA|nr:AAA family ATPase [Thiotrichales bacterium HSG14]